MLDATLRKFFVTFHPHSAFATSYTIIHAADEQDAMDKAVKHYGRRWSMILCEEKFDTFGLTGGVREEIR